MSNRVLFSILMMVSLACQMEAVCPNGCRACTNGMFHCPGAQLDKIPDFIPTDTTTLDLTQNMITSFDGIPKLKDVQSFRMSLNQLRVIPGGTFDDMPEIMSLDLSSNSIRKVYKHGLRGLDNLKSISLNGNNIKDLDLIFWNTPAVTTIRLGNNEIETIQEENFKKNKMIKMLDLSSNKISSIHGNAFQNLNMLRYLILSNNPIKRLDDLVFTSTMLSLADFSNCQLEAVPRTMPPSLMDFRLGNNMITEIKVNDFENMTSLTLLTLNDNKISQVEHRSFDNLENLKELWLSRNDLVYIPRGLPKELMKLFIDNNVVVELVPRLFKEDSHLKVLSLENNKVRKIHPDSFTDTQEIEGLNLQGNQLTQIEADTFSDLPALSSLTLTENPIQMFEEGAFSELNSLTELTMSYIDASGASLDKLLQENFLLSMPNLVTINLMNSGKLSQAFIDIFDKTSGETLDKVTTVNLQYSELTTLGEGLKRLFPNLKTLLLDENIFHCDQRLVWLNEWMKTAPDVTFYQYEEPKCNSPEELKGRPITTLDKKEFVAVTVNELDKPVPDLISNEAINGQNTPETEASETSRADETPGGEVNPPTTRVPVQPPSGNGRAPVPDLSGQRSQTSSSYIGGTRVVIKPPSKETSNKPNDKKNTRKMTRAERKAARKAERERKRRERLARRRSESKREDSKRTKRRIRNEKSKKCTTDKDGNKKCRRKKNRCKVQSDGSVKCRKRNGKNRKKKASESS